MRTVTIEEIVARWTAPDARPLGKGALIADVYDDDGTPDGPPCYCAQGDILHFAGYSDDELRDMEQARADIETATLLGISVTHAALLRVVNDGIVGSPERVLLAPETVLGPYAKRVLAFYRRLDAMTDAEVSSTSEAARIKNKARIEWDARAAAATEAAGIGYRAWAEWAAKAVGIARAAWTSRVVEATRFITGHARAAWGKGGVHGTLAAEYAICEIIAEIDPPYFLPFFDITALTDLDKEPGQ